MKIKIDYPKSTAEAIRCVCYLRAWRVGKLAKTIGTDTAYLSKVLNGCVVGTDAMTARVMAHMPENVEVVKR